MGVLEIFRISEKMIAAWTLLIVFVAVHGQEYNGCEKISGGRGVCVKQGDCATSEYGHFCAYGEVCCSEDKRLDYTGPVAYIYREKNYCEFLNGELGIRVKEAECPTPERGYSTGLIGNYMEICCPVASFRNKETYNELDGFLEELESKRCRFVDGDYGMLVKEKDCPISFYGSSGEHLENSEEICCPLSHLQYTGNKDKEVVPEPEHNQQMKANYNVCEKVSGERGICVKTEDCAKSEHGFFCTEGESCCSEGDRLTNDTGPAEPVEDLYLKRNYCDFPNGDLGQRMREQYCPTPECGYYIGQIGNDREICCPFNFTDFDRFLAEMEKKSCRLLNGDAGTLVKENKCPSFNGSSSGSLGNSSEICCSLISLQFLGDEDKGLVPGPIEFNRTIYESCQISETDLGLCVKETNCTTPSGENTCGSSEAICCPVSKLRYAPEEESFQISSRFSNPGDISKQKCYNLLTDAGSGFIYGGRAAEQAEFPHMAAVGYGDENAIQWNCGGALISQRHVLTAAHCVISEIPSVIRLGDLDLSNDTQLVKPDNYRVKQVYIHDGYKPPAKYHDIAIIELTKKVFHTKFIEFACLDTSRYHSDSVYIVAGWGRTEYAGPASPKLLTAEVVPYEKERCRKGYGLKEELYANGIVDEYMICAGGGKDTCSGDSGGPLFALNQNLTQFLKRKVYDIIGVTSFGKACGLTPHPGVYTRVQPYVPWIESIVWPEPY